MHIQGAFPGLRRAKEERGQNPGTASLFSRWSRADVLRSPYIQSAERAVQSAECIKLSMASRVQKQWHCGKLASFFASSVSKFPWAGAAGAEAGAGAGAGAGADACCLWSAKVTTSCLGTPTSMEGTDPCSSQSRQKYGGQGPYHPPISSPHGPIESTKIAFSLSGSITPISPKQALWMFPLVFFSSR